MGKKQAGLVFVLSLFVGLKHWDYWSSVVRNLEGTVGSEFWLNDTVNPALWGIRKVRLEANSGWMALLTQRCGDLGRYDWKRTLVEWHCWPSNVGNLEGMIGNKLWLNDTVDPALWGIWKVQLEANSGWEY